jgi:hypothetical protein
MSPARIAFALVALSMLLPDVGSADEKLSYTSCAGHVDGDRCNCNMEIQKCSGVCRQQVCEPIKRPLGAATPLCFDAPPGTPCGVGKCVRGDCEGLPPLH